MHTVHICQPNNLQELDKKNNLITNKTIAFLKKPTREVKVSMEKTKCTFIYTKLYKTNATKLSSS